MSDCFGYESRTMAKKKRGSSSADALSAFRANSDNGALTTNQGVKIADDQNSLRAGDRGPSLLEDHLLREKLTHFDHERIPERVVHARGAGAHGYFQAYESMAKYTRAGFLQDPSVRTPVFVRFSTVGGSRGSADTVRDVRGFAVKFYTQEGNYDLVGNNMPVFFIQDAVKFPDFVHAVKPEPHNEIPQASSAHDTFWDFCSLTPESTHMLMWLMSDRAIPKSYRMMEGFGVHTYRFINEAGEGRFVKFHWKPVLGMASLAWDEAQKLAGKDADFNRRDLWESIENGHFPEWELGVQIFGDKDADGFPFDILDPTKLVPEELVPVQRIGKMTLDRNPDNFFAETEQVAFCVSHVVPGIDFSNDPLLQGRIFSYLDTQLSRLGGPNFHEIPINRPQCPFHNNQQDGMHRMTINPSHAQYEPNSIENNGPLETPVENGGFASYPERIDGVKRRVRSESFKDHFSQATLFWKSMTPPEQDHIVSAFTFELSKLERPGIRERMVANLAQIDATLVSRVARNLNMPAPSGGNGKPKTNGKKTIASSPALSIVAQGPAKSIETRKVALLANAGVDAAAVKSIVTGLGAKGVTVKVVSSRIGPIDTSAGVLEADYSMDIMPSIAFDGVIAVGELASGAAIHYVQEAYTHGKPVAALAANAFERTGIAEAIGDDEGVIATTGSGGAKELIDRFASALAVGRYWDRRLKDAIPA